MVSVKLEQEEIQALLMNLAHTRGDKGFSNADAEVLVAWVYKARVRNEIADRFVAGDIRADVQDGRVVLSPLEAEKLVA